MPASFNDLFYGNVEGTARPWQRRIAQPPQGTRRQPPILQNWQAGGGGLLGRLSLPGPDGIGPAQPEPDYQLGYANNPAGIVSQRQGIGRDYYNRTFGLPSDVQRNTAIAGEIDQSLATAGNTGDFRNGYSSLERAVRSPTPWQPVMDNLGVPAPPKPYEYGMSQEWAQERADQRAAARANMSPGLAYGPANAQPFFTEGERLTPLTRSRPDSPEFAAHMARKGPDDLADRQRMVQANAMNAADARRAKMRRLPWDAVRTPAEAAYEINPTDEGLLAANLGNPWAAPAYFQGQAAKGAAEMMGDRMAMQNEQAADRRDVAILTDLDASPEDKQAARGRINRKIGGGGGSQYPPGSPMALTEGWEPADRAEYFNPKTTPQRKNEIAAKYTSPAAGDAKSALTVPETTPPSWGERINALPTWGKDIGLAAAAYGVPATFAKTFPWLAGATGRSIGGLLGTNWGKVGGGALPGLTAVPSTGPVAPGVSAGPTVARGPAGMMGPSATPGAPATLAESKKLPWLKRVLKGIGGKGVSPLMAMDLLGMLQQARGQAVSDESQLEPGKLYIDPSGRQRLRDIRGRSWLNDREMY